MAHLRKQRRQCRGGNALGAPLVVGAGGYIYGVTGAGGPHGYGVAYRLNPNNHKVQVVHNFNSKGPFAPGNLLLGKDGKDPSGPVVVGPNGNLYGETFFGGTGGDGIIYEITPDGSTYTILHNFNDGTIPNDGSAPSGGLTLGADNNLYGTTGQGGAYGVGPGSFGYGTLFKLSP